MSEPQRQNVCEQRIPMLERIASRGQVWERVAEKHGVTNPLPPWKSSLDGTCDALNQNDEALPMLQRRGDEDLLSQTTYSALPAPENQLVALAHSLVARGVIEEEALARRIAAVRTRLEAAGTATVHCTDG
jgi:hypothetical protein